MTLNWLRLAGIVALALGGLAMFFLLRRAEGATVALLAGTAATLAAIIGRHVARPLPWFPVVEANLLAKLGDALGGRRHTQKAQVMQWRR